MDAPAPSQQSIVIGKQSDACCPKLERSPPWADSLVA